MRSIFLTVLLVFCGYACSAEAVLITREFGFRGNLYRNSYMDAYVIEMAKQLAGKHPNDYRAHYLLAMQCIGIDKECVQKELNIALKLKKDHAPTLYLLGGMAFEAGAYDKAKEYFQKAIKINPKESACYHALARVYQAQSNSQLMRQTYEDALKVINSEASLYFNYALVLAWYWPDELEKMQANVEKAVSFSPTDEEYNEMLGMIYLRAGNYSAARKVYQEMVGRNSEHIFAQLGLAASFKNIGDYEKAIEIIKEALKKNPCDEVIKQDLKETEEEFKSRSQK